MRLQGMIGNQAVQRMIQRQVEMEEMEIPVEGESSNPVVLDEMEVPVEGSSDESGAITRPDGVVEFPPDHVPHPEGKEYGPATPQAPKDSADDSGAKTGPDGTVEFPPDHVPSEGEPTVGPDGTLEFPPDHVPSSDEGGSWLDNLPFF